VQFNLKLKLIKELGYEILKIPGVYEVYGNPNSKISERGSWNGNSWVWSLTWRKRICE
jgi:hypothetical protein